jgi:Fe2+ or Zn2+ uptake regulation protein
MARKTAARLKEHGINPSAQRVAIGQFVLHTNRHPTAEEVLKNVRKKFPMVSRATVYNTLNLFVEKGLLRRCNVPTGNVVFDSHVENHHHFIDESTGVIHDVPWDAIQVSNVQALDGFQVKEYQVVMKGRKKRHRKQAAKGSDESTSASVQ